MSSTDGPTIVINTHAGKATHIGIYEDGEQQAGAYVNASNGIVTLVLTNGLNEESFRLDLAGLRILASADGKKEKFSVR